MSKHRILWMPGDGVGPEISTVARLVLDALEFDAEYVHGDIGWEFWCKEGDALPKRTTDALADIGVAFFGAITSKGKEAQQELAPELKHKGLKYISPIVRLRQQFDLYKCVRPCKAYPGNPVNYQDGIDLVVFRENTQCLYCGIEASGADVESDAAIKNFFEGILGHPKAKPYHEVPIETITASVRVFDEKACRKIVTAGFEYAKAHGYPKVTIVEKQNVVRRTSGQMVAVAEEIAKDYPDIYLDVTNIDAQCMWLVKDPLNYGVLVSSNMFGDIISDLCAQLIGGLGFAYSGNVGDKFGVFEPTAGSAPKYTGQWRMNPIAAIQAAKMMLEFVGENEKAEQIDKGISKVISERKVMTYDMQRGLKPKLLLEPLKYYALNLDSRQDEYVTAMQTLEDILSTIEPKYAESVRPPAGTIDMTVAVIRAMEELGYVDAKRVKSLGILDTYKPFIRLPNTMEYLEMRG